MPLPEGFASNMERILGSEDAAALCRALDDTPSVSIRLNRRKVGSKEAEERVLSLFNSPRPVKWCASGYYLPERPDFVLDPLLHAGVYYVQEAASMIYEDLVARISGGYEGELKVLDLCAAPGGKATAMLNGLIGKDYELVANEFDRKRVKILKENLDKWGDPGVVITNSSTGRFAEMENYFDIVAVDAPCSGEGMMRREPIARSQWSEELVEQCRGLQREILSDAAKALRPGGTLIYSTCTFNERENEGNALWIEESLGLKPVLQPMRFYPHRDTCEGLFAAAFIKPSVPDDAAFQPKRMPAEAALRNSGINIVSAGIEKTVRKGDLEIPSSRTVLAYDYDRNTFPTAELSLEEARRYIRRNAITLSPDTPKGYVAVTYKGYPLGLVKNLGNRANNLFPQEWRVLK